MTTHTAKSKPSRIRRVINLVKAYITNPIWISIRAPIQSLRFSKYIKRDIGNIITYGWHAPKYAERIFINPQNVKLISEAGFSRNDSGRVLGGDWDLNSKPLQSLKKIAIVFKHIETGKTWKECGAYENMLELMEAHPGADDCHNENDVIERYERLTDLIQHLKNGGEFYNSSNFRESGGLFVHIGRDGEIIFGGGGCHRMAISQKLGLTKIPAQIGVIHIDFLRNQYQKLKILRKQTS
jgi:hypothetical protein